jgi:protein-tyrosine phosphatase
LLAIQVVYIVTSGLSYLKDDDIAEHLVLQAEDIPSFDISKHFETGISFIERHRKHTNILVHCHAGKANSNAGISRSSTMVIAYLMKTKDWKCEKVW